MNQTYCVGPLSNGRRHVLYRYGNYCYVDDLVLSSCNSTSQLPRLLKELQAVQSKMTYVCRLTGVCVGVGVVASVLLQCLRPTACWCVRLSPCAYLGVANALVLRADIWLSTTTSAALMKGCSSRS